IACGQALFRQGRTVRMLDVGIELEPARADFVAQLGATAPAQWDPRLVSVLKEGMASTSKGIPQKLVYGSDFPYREVDQHVPCSYEGIGLKPSLAQGGFSNVWGAAMMPYLDADLAAWPVNTLQLAEHYVAVLDITGIAARQVD